MKSQICILALLFLIQLGICAGNQLQQLEKMVEKLQDTVMSVTIENAKLQDAVLSVTTENAKYSDLIENLVEKVAYQERRIWILETECKTDDSIYPKMKTNKTSDEQINKKDYAFVEAMYPKKTSLIGQIMQKAPQRRSVDSGHENVAFFSYLSGDLREPSPGHVLVFDVAPTNNGGHYNRYAGMFTAPHSGTYVFTWTSYYEAGGYTNLQLVVNANAVDSSYCNADGASWYRSASGTAVVQIGQGDVVFVRTHHYHTNYRDLLSKEYLRTTFAGWSLS